MRSLLIIIAFIVGYVLGKRAVREHLDVLFVGLLIVVSLLK